MRLGNWLRGGGRGPDDERRPEPPRRAREKPGREADDRSGREDDRSGREPEAGPRVRARDRSGERKLRAAVERAEREDEAKPRAKRRSTGGDGGERKPARGPSGERKRTATPERERADRRDRKRKDGRRSEQGDRRPTRSRKRRRGKRPSIRAGIRGARGQARLAANRLGRSARPALAALLAIGGTVAVIYLTLLSALLRLAITIVGRVARPVRAALRRLDLIVRRLSALLTPRRALIAVVAGAAVLLGLSQFADYRSLSIGTAAYDSVQTIAPPPETGRAPMGSAHAYAFVPLAALCLVALLVALRTRRPQLLRVLASIGAAAIVVALLVDRPQGLDVGATALSFDDVQAHLLGGFYAQLAAGLLLLCSSLLLARDLREAPAPGRRCDRRRPPRRATVEGAGA